MHDRGSTTFEPPSVLDVLLDEIDRTGDILSDLVDDQPLFDVFAELVDVVDAVAGLSARASGPEK